MQFNECEFQFISKLEFGKKIAAKNNVEYRSKKKAAFRKGGLNAANRTKVITTTWNNSIKESTINKGIGQADFTSI